MLANRKLQLGAAMVEMALTISLFLLLVFGIIEFALAYFAWARTNEAVREVVREAMVSDPVVDITTLACPGDSVTVTCSDAACAPLLAIAQRSAPFVPGGKLQVTYACSPAGNPDRPVEMRILEVTAVISDLEYDFVVPSIIGMDATMRLPTATASRTGEDLYTERAAP